MKNLESITFNEVTYYGDIYALARDLVRTSHCELDRKHTEYTASVFSVNYGFPVSKIFKDAEYMIQRYKLRHIE